MMDEAEADVIAFMAFPKSHWPKLHSTNAIERLNKEVGAILLEQNDEWQIQHRYMTLETMNVRTDEQPTALTHIAA